MSNPYDFGVREEGQYDVVLKVDGRRFLVMRHHVGAYSPVFYDKFCENGNVNPNEEIELTDDFITADGLQLFLELINGRNRISDETIESVLNISFNWQARIPIEACLHFLIGRSTLDNKTRFALADKFKIFALVMQVISGIETVDDLDEILPDSIENLQPETSALVFQKAREILRAAAEAPANVAVAQQEQHDRAGGVARGVAIFRAQQEAIQQEIANAAMRLELSDQRDNVRRRERQIHQLEANQRNLLQEVNRLRTENERLRIVQERTNAALNHRRRGRPRSPP